MDVLGDVRREFLLRMFEEAMRAYACFGEEWSEDEKELLPLFRRILGFRKLVLDLAGGYGRVTPYLMDGENFVVLADLSMHSLKFAKGNLKAENVDFVRVDMRFLPFSDCSFDGVWFTQAFEYIPPNERENFVQSLRKILKTGGVVFVNVAKVPNECSLLDYIKNFVYWKVIKRQPIVWGEYIYKLKLPHYEGWHYHSVVFTKRIEKVFTKRGFKILKARYDKKGYFTYILQAY